MQEEIKNENKGDNKYLIAYVSTYNERVLTETVYAKTQKEAVYAFELIYLIDKEHIIAITKIEEQ